MPVSKVRKLAIDLGFDREWADRLAKERPQDVERWATLGMVPPEEDPRTQ